MSDPFPNLHAALPAFRMIALLVRCRNGRRRQWLEQMARVRVHVPEPGNTARVTPMLGRSARRKRVRELRAQVKRRQPEMNRHKVRDAMPFRPVYGHGIPVKEPHADVIAMLKTKNHDTAQRWAEKQAASKLPPVETQNQGGSSVTRFAKAKAKAAKFATSPN